MSAQPRTIAVVRGGALGDVVLGLPALRALRRRYPAAAITAVAPRPQVGLALRGGVATSVLDFGDPAFVPLFTGDAERVPAALRQADAVVLWLRDSAGVAETLSRAGPGQVLESSPYPPPGVRVHVADWLLHSLRPLGVEPISAWDEGAWIETTAGDLAAAGSLLPRGALPGSYVVVHPGSGSARKNWPAECWLDVLPVAAARPVVCLAGPADEDPVARLQAAAGAAGEPPLPVVRPDSLDALLGVLVGAALYLGNDSGVTHAAAAAGTPVVAVFGPTDPSIWRPRGPHVEVLGGAVAGDIFAAEPAWPDLPAVRAAAAAQLNRGGPPLRRPPST